ncbi:MAG: hypothetical protein SH868_17095 [Bythopirellula sp.]|nr:hypothetical protein [Bythopirellula sp.]
MPTEESLQEYTDSRGVAVRVDREEGVLWGVKLIGLSSRNGRRYREAALANAIALYEDAKVNVNHPKDGPLAPRDYQDRLGVMRGVEFRAGEGLFGNLHFNPKHALAEQLAWDAAHNPRNVGFSHNVQAKLSRTNDGVIVEEITRVQSVDLVADPAATEGLFEQEQPFETWDALTLETLRLHRPDLLAEIEASGSTQLTTLREETEARIAVLERGQRISELLVKHGLPVPARLGVAVRGGQRIINAAFIESLLTLADEQEVERRIVERAELVRSASSWHDQLWRGSPRSRDQLAIGESRRESEASSRDFARGLKVVRN